MKEIHIFGPVNTGTNLIIKIINNCKCIDKTTQQILHAGDQLKLWNNQTAIKHCTNINVIQNDINNSDTLAIIMYKNVYNWIYSLKKKSYEIKFNGLNKPVIFNKNIYKNAIQLYNYYYSTYINLINKNKNVIFLDYYKIIDKETCFNYINSKLEKYNLYLESNNKLIETLNKSSKDHGNPVKNSDEALKSYLSNKLLVKKFIIRNTNINKDVNNQIIKYFE